MKTNSNTHNLTGRPKEREAKRLTLMAIQEKLGLFSKKELPPEDQQAQHDYLKNKPLGLI